ncbi:NUDIX hydrolase [Aliiroseovarius sp. KMU-50]|uniref:NUDIX hydrolase n=1 Tax=Aliiroseovarius salicola TaxID=3009082 RepID=A0ABT4VW83_9RHOB|nr:NUDIX hydrolase [Aliiroseovarius sp. KMU-50]MDA5092505.1 NUDIX hydrolase [Aliiroseovarius sp. KMU-50]
MPPMLKYAWDEFVFPMFRRPRRAQVAALCYRGNGDEKEVLLITSRGTGRWILPKGWLMEDRPASEAAAQEAWEEAGVTKGNLNETPVGAFSYDKELEDGAIAPCEATVFQLKVKELTDDFPEANERNRTWVRPDEAVKMVNEPGLKKLLRNF